MSSSSPSSFSGIEQRAADAPAPLWASGLSLGFGLGFALLAAESSAQLTTIALLTGSAAAGGFGVFGLAERLIRARGRGPVDRAAAFQLLFATAPEPTVLLDATGRIRAFNRAARRAAPGSARRAVDLAPTAEDAEGLVYRLLREALQDRAVREIVRAAPAIGQPEQAIEICAWPCGQGLVAWRWRALEETAETPLDRAASIAWFCVDDEGRITETSRQFDLWTNPDGVAPGLAVAENFAGAADDDPPIAARRVLTARAVFPDLDGRSFEPGVGAAASLARTRLRGGFDAPASVSLLIAPFPKGGAICIATPGLKDAAIHVGQTAEMTPPAALGRSADAMLEALEALNAARLFEDAPIGVAVLSGDGRILRLNAAADRLLSGRAETPADALGSGYGEVGSGRAGQALGRPLIDLLAEDDREEAVRRLAGAQGEAQTGGRAASSDGAPPSFEARLAVGGDSDGEIRVAQFYATRVDSPTGPLLICYAIDASERRALEERFHQTQKLQAVGQLAGGVAHDFNNLLTVIIAASEMLLQRHAAEDPDFADLNAIYQNAHRAANLVGQLLAFSRKQTLRPQVVNLTERMSDLSYLLNRLIGEKVVLRQELSEELWDARVDVNQFEQVITNLVVNARDAMPDGGRITLRTRNETYEQNDTKPHQSMPPGDYVCIEIEDTGCGIPKDKREKIFEPFYTTKGVGEGTGLGLSTVYGIVKQTGGFIFVDSEVGAGSNFRILLHRHVGAPARELDEAVEAVDLVDAGELSLAVTDMATEVKTLDQETIGASVRRARTHLADLISDPNLRADPPRASRRSGGGRNGAIEPAAAETVRAEPTPTKQRQRKSVRVRAAAGAKSSGGKVATSLAAAGKVLADNVATDMSATDQPAAVKSKTSQFVGPVATPPRSAAEPLDLSGSEKILLVEDEAPVRALTARALRARGYEVMEAECGEDALEMLQDDALKVDLLLSDVVMPNMDGPTLLRQISDRRPELRTLFMSGYARDAFSGAFEADLKGRNDFGFLQKPFTLDALARAVKQQISR